MKEPLISIIVPIYNVEKYIEKCVESLVHQNYANVEIILVDDGSPDKSGEIAEQYAATNSSIKVIRQKNSGVSEARNAGLRVANGEYVMFVDGDDWVEPDYVSFFVQMVETHNCEIGFNVGVFRAEKQPRTDKENVIVAEDGIAGIYAGKYDVAVWNKIYRKSLLEKGEVLFNPEIWYGEGMLFNIEVLQLVDQLVVGCKPVYHQTFNPESAMRKFNLESNKCGLRSLEIQKSKWKKSNKQIELQWKYHKYRFNLSILNGIVRSDMLKDYSDVAKECVSNIRKGILLPIRCESRVKSKLNWLCYFVAPYKMAKRAARKHQQYVNTQIANT